MGSLTYPCWDVRLGRYPDVAKLAAKAAKSSYAARTVCRNLPASSLSFALSAASDRADDST